MKRVDYDLISYKPLELDLLNTTSNQTHAKVKFACTLRSNCYRGFKNVSLSNGSVFVVVQMTRSNMLCQRDVDYVCDKRK